MKNIVLLKDYKGNFGYKFYAEPYKSGLDQLALHEAFVKHGYRPEFLLFTDIDFRRDNYQDVPIAYTSSQDWGGYYKGYIEDVLYGMNLQGAKLLPHFKYFRAHHNKVFMEILRDLMLCDEVKNISSRHFGTLEDVLRADDSLAFPCVLKQAAGSGSQGVTMAKDKTELKAKAVKLCRTPYWKEEFKDVIRAQLHKGYRRGSRFRRKVIIQNFVHGLSNDWKVLIYGHRYYIFFRPTRKNDFRASGSGHKKYIWNDDCQVPPGIFDYAEKIFNIADVPHLSLDIMQKDGTFYLVEFQAVHFGTVGQEKAHSHYERNHIGQWIRVSDDDSTETVYAESLVRYLER